MNDTKIYGDESLSRFTWTAELIEATEDGAKMRLVPDDPEVGRVCRIHAASNAP